MEKYFTILVYASSVLFLAGCANIEPRDRNFIAQEHMDINPDPLNKAFREHVYFSKEGTSGGEGIGGGGCGCN